MLRNYRKKRESKIEQGKDNHSYSSSKKVPMTVYTEAASFATILPAT